MSWSGVRRVALLGCTVAALVAVTGASGGASEGSAAPPLAPEATVAYPPFGLAEASGLVASVLHDGVVWVVEDSGEPVVRAYDPSGAEVASVLFAASDVFAGDNRDTESLAIGPGPTLWSADIGDNNEVRETVLVHTTPEPAVLDGLVVTAESYRFRLPDGPSDAEVFLVDPVDGRAYLVTKNALGGVMYAAPTELVVGQTHDLEYVQEVPGWLSGGDFSPDGALVAVRTLGLGTTSIASIYGVVRDPGGGPIGLDPRAEVRLPAQEQGESLAFTADARALLVGSEGADEPIWSVPIPPEVLDVSTPRPSEPSPATAGASPPDDTAADQADRSTADCRPTNPMACLRSGSDWVAVVLVGLAAVLVGAIAVLRRR